MQTQVRPPRQRSSGGRTLMLLGLVLALAAAGLVLYVTNSVQGTFASTVSVVVASQNLAQGAILTLNDATAPDVRIADAFAVKQMDKKLVPADAYQFSNPDALNTYLNNQVVKDPFLAGDILRNPDPRLAAVGTTSGTSLTNLNPPALPNGSVLYVLTQTNDSIGVQPGDTVNIIATGPGTGTDPLTGKTIQTISKTILSKIFVYAVDVPAKGKIVVVVTNQQAELLSTLEHGGYTLTIVIRKPGDPGNPTDGAPLG